MMSVLRVARPMRYQYQRIAVLRIIRCQAYKSVIKSPVVESKSSLVLFKIIKQQKYYFQTTPRRDISPIIALILRPLIRIGAFLFGRAFRKWWAKQSVEERHKYSGWFSRKKQVFFGIMGAFLFGLVLYYGTHIQTDPLTNRSRFIMFDKKQQAALSKIIFEMHLETFKDTLITKDHPTYKKLIKITEQILNANKDLESIKDKQWTLTVVNSPLKNSYVLPGGNIFVFLGMLEIVENEDQLAVILSHEMAHALLDHSIEQLSNGIILDLLLALPIAIIWAFFPDLLAIIFQFLGQTVIDLIHHLPYSRALENEADQVGLILCAKACVDVREAVVFWGMMRVLTELKVEPQQIPLWLSTHPDHGDREKTLNNQMEKALERRSYSGCPPLPSIDPRKRFYALTSKEHETIFKRRGIIPIS
ncbi:metalloendopeptidase OMA1, mitochondrial [Cephus cinctus]|uniref:Metalloendopeptidase OMA1, mitochondrial n=1 Tax=Cephus cinctus TaxID=211228 RepID=A0AAJ7RHF1_CEPCN|nr:metalloendopeptidase OMA1, mitochondrial [Cephus cinctus]XP_024940456.1 metalloendopeptidase OMA1, mitochondrial [Cephus cinctus]